MVHDLSSPLLIVGAGIVGVLTVYLIELLNSTRLMKEDSAIGVVFPLLFSIAVILISKYASNIHLDVDAVLLGELAFTPFNTTKIFGITVAKGLVSTFSIFIINLLFIVIFFKELKISTFDKALAATLGMKPVLIHYILMSLVSMTSVASFEAVGSILVVAFMIFLSIILGAVSSILGFFFATVWDVSIAGMIAVVIGVIFIFVLIISPKKGLISTFRRKKKQKVEFSTKILLIHIFNHSNTESEKEECGIDTMEYHLRWDRRFFNKILERAKERKFIYIDSGIFKISDKGKEYIQYKHI